MPLHLRYVTHSEIGLVRKNNQDSGFASPHLLVVADGMGGAAAGDLASAVAVDTLIKIDGHPESGTMLEVLTSAIHQANDRIADLVDDDLSLEGMGTTVTGALFDGSQLGLAHIGDSRAYLLRDGRLERLTHDHSWVQSLVDEGKISVDEAAVHPHRSLLLKVLNGQPANEPDVTTIPVRAGDRLLFCSDGVCGLVDDPEIAEAMQLEAPEDAVRRLVADAHDAGGIDNITIVLADVVEAESDASPVVLGAAATREIPASSHGTAGRGGGDTDPVEDTVIVGPGAAATQGATDDDDESRYTPQPPAKRRVGRTLAVLVVLVLVLGAALGAGYAWTRTQYFVAAADERVAIYQGLPDGVPGIPLSRVYEIQDLKMASLPPFYQTMVRSAIEVESLNAARETVSALKVTAKRCQGRAPSPTPSRSPAATPGGTGSPAPSSSGATPETTSSAVSTESPPSTSGPGTSSPSAPSTSAPDRNC
ncbi:MAG TPA: protein phosphatase 2C domain-containing protein [Propionibacteriaceae bacterium]|nr:protein phosphatase 2C domain-containing protein [Propionibacteriaceae bacterium]